MSKEQDTANLIEFLRTLPLEHVRLIRDAAHSIVGVVETTTILDASKEVWSSTIGDSYSYLIYDDAATNWVSPKIGGGSIERKESKTTEEDS